MRGGNLLCIRGAQLGRFAVRQQGEIQQTVGVVIGGPKQLATGDVFIDRRNTTFQTHFCRIDRFAHRQFRQCGAISTQQEDGFDVVAAGLFQRQRRQFAISDAAFSHYPVDGQIELLLNLGDAELGKRVITPSSVRLQGMGGGDSLLAPFDGNVHQHTST